LEYNDVIDEQIKNGVKMEKLTMKGLLKREKERNDRYMSDERKKYIISYFMVVIGIMYLGTLIILLSPMVFHIVVGVALIYYGVKLRK
jgi:hypothetical protein